ncbi:hypothetical protein TNCV_4807501 [Trichonephila clavipes]|nr:hypothetical protein TNCV_4807501 [Trichonephila clavipes]
MIPEHASPPNYRNNGRTLSLDRLIVDQPLHGVINLELVLLDPNSPRAIEFWTFHPRSATFNPIVQFTRNIFDILFHPQWRTLVVRILEESCRTRFVVVTYATCLTMSDRGPRNSSLQRTRCTPDDSRNFEHHAGDIPPQLRENTVVVSGYCPPLFLFHPPHERTCGSTAI